MYHVQIIDDEPIIRMGLSKMVNWNALGFEITCLAANGKQALEQLEIEKVDLIITDIEMPIMDGLSYIREVRSREEESDKSSNKEIIVLTAYEDFEYAKTAIRHGVSEYVLKPIDTEEFTQILLQIKKKLDEKELFR